MRISRYNHEGYYDPTTYRALKSIDKEQKRLDRFRPFVYICSPYQETLKRNNANIQRYCRFAVEHGALPIAPQLYFSAFMDDSNIREHETITSMSLILMKRCTELWIFGDRISRRMEQEIQRAEKRKMTIRRFTTRCKEVT